MPIATDVLILNFHVKYIPPDKKRPTCYQIPGMSDISLKKCINYGSLRKHDTTEINDLTPTPLQAACDQSTRATNPVLQCWMIIPFRCVYYHQVSGTMVYNCTCM